MKLFNALDSKLFGMRENRKNGPRSGMVLAFCVHVPLKVLLHFFRNFVWLSLSITLFQCLVLWGTGKNEFILILLLTKLTSNVLIATMFLFLQADKLYFYHNLGLTRLELFGSALLFDMIFWVTAIAITTFVS